MDKEIYIDKLNNLEIIMNKYEQTPFNNFAKVLCLATMNMSYEKVAFNKNINDHPYILTKRIIEDTIHHFNSLMEINFIENENKTVSTFFRSFIQGSSKRHNFLGKNEVLWQEIWTRHNEDEFQNFIDLKAMRLEVNNLVEFVNGQDCIEFGCGNGAFSFALLEKGAKTVTSIDFGVKSIEYANNYSKKHNLESKAKFYVRDVTKSGFKDKEFSFAVSNGVFHHLLEEDIPLAFKEVARVLKSGGWFWYYVDGEGAISMDLWDKSVDILSDIDILQIEACLLPLNIKRSKMVHIMDGLNATYLHSNWTEVIELLSSCGFQNFKRLTGGTSTDFDDDIITHDPYGKEKFGCGDLRIVCQRV